MIGSVAALTDVGESREHNEDGFLILDMRTGTSMPDSSSGIALEADPLVVVVSDGMGGASAGEVASSLTLEVLQKAIAGAGAKLTGYPPDAMGSWLAEVIQEANRTVKATGQEDAAVRGMGATVTAAAVTADEVIIGHVGDSRAYLLRDGQLQQLTTDHTFVGQMVARGHLTPEEARKHDHRHLLLQAVGAKDILNVDTISRDILPGDHLLLCSDGLYDLVDDPSITRILSGNGEPEDRCRALVDAALAAGGFDNITVIVLRVL